MSAKKSQTSEDLRGEAALTKGRRKIGAFGIGDTVEVHVRILEGKKARIQIIRGVVTDRSGSGSREMFVVHGIVQGEGVAWKSRVHSPRIADIVVKRSGEAARLKRIIDRAVEVFDSKPKALLWLSRPNRALGNEVPEVLLKSDLGARRVEDVLGRIEQGIYS